MKKIPLDNFFSYIWIDDFSVQSSNDVSKWCVLCLIKKGIENLKNNTLCVGFLKMFKQILLFELQNLPILTGFCIV